MNSTVKASLAVDEWSKGSLNKMGIWGYYVVANFIGSIYCCILFFSAAKNPRKTSNEVFIATLCTGCIWMSVSCGTECLLSMVHGGRFYGGDWACQIEGIFHISAILVQFLSNTMLAVRSLLSIVYQYTISVRGAVWSSLAIWVVCVVGTIGQSYNHSPIYLMSAGTYCFFGFSSPAIAGWLIPGLALALITMLVCYTWIAIYVRQSPANAIQKFSMPAKPMQVPSGDTAEKSDKSDKSDKSNPDKSNPEQTDPTPQHSKTHPWFVYKNKTAGAVVAVPETPIHASETTPVVGGGIPVETPMSNARNSTRANKLVVSPRVKMDEKTRPVSMNDGSAIARRIMIRSAWFVAILLLGWVFAAVATTYELAVGLSPEWLVTAVGVGGVTHSIAVPWFYSYTSAYHRRTMRLILGCRFRRCCRCESAQAPFQSQLTIAIDAAHDHKRDSTPHQTTAHHATNCDIAILEHTPPPTSTKQTFELSRK